MYHISKIILNIYMKCKEINDTHRLFDEMLGRHNVEYFIY